ncbi:hypothetical protein BCR36DRAFT_286521, partial [Piromyces finnis]
MEITDNNKNTAHDFDINNYVKNENNKHYNIALNFDVIQKLHQVKTNISVNNTNANTNANTNINTNNNTNINTNTNANNNTSIINKDIPSTSRTGSSYASYIVGVSLTLGLLIFILSTATILSYIQKRKHRKFLELKEKERRIKLGQSVQSLKSTNDVLNLLSDTTKSEINTHPFSDDKNVPLFQIGIYPNYSYKDLEKKFKPKSEKDISTLFEEYNNPPKSNTQHSFTNNSNVASFFKNSRLYSQTLPSVNDVTEMNISNSHGMGYTHGSSNGIPSGSSTLHHSQNYSGRHNSSPSYSQTQSESCTESMDESYDECVTGDPDKSVSLSQSIFTALKQKHSLRESYKTKIGMDLMNISYNKNESFSHDPSDISRFSAIEEDSEPLPYYSLDMSESENYNTEISDSMDEIGDLTMQTMTSRYSRAKTDDMNTSFSPSFIIASEKVMNDNTDSILKDINNQSYFDNPSKKQSFPTVSVLNTTTEGINFSKKPSPYVSINNFNDRLKTKQSNESLSTTISSISNVRSLYNLAPSIYDNYSLDEDSTDMEEENHENSNLRNNSSAIKNSNNMTTSGNPIQSTPIQRNSSSNNLLSSPQQIIKSSYSYNNNTNNYSNNNNNNNSSYINSPPNEIRNEHLSGNNYPNTSSKQSIISPHLSERHNSYLENNNINNTHPSMASEKNELPNHCTSNEHHSRNYLSSSSRIINKTNKSSHGNGSTVEDKNDKNKSNQSTSEIKRTSYNNMLLEIHKIEKENVINSESTGESTDVDSSFQNNSHYNHNLSHSMSLYNSIQEKSQHLHSQSIRIPTKDDAYSYNSNQHNHPSSLNHSSSFINTKQNESMISNKNGLSSNSYHQNSHQYPTYSSQNSLTPSLPSKNCNESYIKSESFIPSPVSNTQTENENNDCQEDDEASESFTTSTYSNSQSISKSDIFLLNSPTLKTAIKKKISSRKKSDERIGNRYHYPALCQKSFKAQCTYMPKNSKKVPINYGDIIKIFQIYDDGWAYGRVESMKDYSFKEGLFPVIEMIEQGGLKEIYPQETSHVSTKSNHSNHSITEDENPNPNPSVHPTPNQNPIVIPSLSSPSLHEDSISKRPSKTSSPKTISTTT